MRAPETARHEVRGKEQDQEIMPKHDPDARGHSYLARTQNGRGTAEIRVPEAADSSMAAKAGLEWTRAAVQVPGSPPAPTLFIDPRAHVLRQQQTGAQFSGRK
jgi:hypothetical protein